MVLKSQGVESARLERQIGCIKYTIFCLDAILWILGGGMLGLSIWLVVEPGFAEWVEFLEISEFYAGIYILIVASVLVTIIAFIGCVAALMENTMALYTHIGLQGLCFILGLAGSAVLLDYSTYDSHIQPIIRRSMSSLISNSQQERPSYILRIIQENEISCSTRLVLYIFVLAISVFAAFVLKAMQTPRTIELAATCRAVAAPTLFTRPTYSPVMPLIRRSLLAMGCCGADGPMDYLNLLKPLPTECRDTVTGNAFFHGCVEEFTWYLEARSGWLAGVSLTLCLLHVVLGVLSLVLIQAKQKEEDAAIFKR